MKRPRYPRIPCSVPGCRRGTTTFEPGTIIICGKHWRSAPKIMRDQESKWRRKALALERKNNPRAVICWKRQSQIWHRILALLSAQPADNDEMSPLMQEELRKTGLL